MLGGGAGRKAAENRNSGGLNAVMHETVQIKRLREMAARRGWTWTGEPGSGFCGRLRIRARTWFVIGADLGLNSASAARIARDKAFAQFFLAQSWIPTIPTRVLHSLEDAQALLGFPVLLKPNEGLGGQGVSIAEDADELPIAWRWARQVSPIVLAQRVIHQREFRVVVFNHCPLLAYEKKPLVLVGNGVSTLRELIPTASLLTDPRVAHRLQRRGLSLASILSPGEQFIPLPVANLKAGGTWRECLAELSPALRNTAIAATDALGLTIAGVDLFAETPEASSCVVNEVNASPGLERLATESAVFDPLFSAIEEFLSLNQEPLIPTNNP